MGLSIERSDFTENEFDHAHAKLRENLRALRLLLQRPGFGVGEPSLGAELELHIVDDNGQALPLNREVLAESLDPQLQLELDRFNLEYNLAPVPARGKPFAAMQGELEHALATIDQKAELYGGTTVGIGILPTLSKQQLDSGSMTDLPRYHALSKGIERIRKGELRIVIDGAEPLDEVCQGLSVEGANTSFQLHLRVNPEEFAATYNAAQLMTPVALSVAANSPFLFGHDLWDETRIALFKQSVDTRGADSHEWRRAARVPFGEGWVRDGAYELFAESCLNYPILIPLTSSEDPLAIVGDGGVPELAELRLQQGTIWNWNRAVYDASNSGHLRIEFRALPSGPTPVDVMANAAFLLGLTMGIRDQIDELLPALPFRYAQYNFYRSAQRGLDAELLWPELDSISPETVTALDLCQRLLPVAERGLSKLGVDEAESTHLLNLIRQRINKKINPAVWQRKTLERFSNKPREKGLVAMLREYMKNAKSGAPFSEW
ncbi:MAG: glutamate--cysteine ligase [Pseudomonadota bacterium]